MPPKKVIIAGAGISGLSAAVRLAKNGYQVEIFEKLNTSGGDTAPFTEAGFTYDAVPTFLIMPSFIREVFQAVGEDIDDYFKLKRLPVHFKMFYPDQSTLTIYQDREKTKAELSKIEEGAGQKYENFLSDIGETYNELHRHLYQCFRPRDLLSSDFIRLIYLLKPFSNFYKYVSRYFESTKLRWAFSFQTLFSGVNPLDAPASYIVLPYLEHVQGVYYPDGGINQIEKALDKIARNFGVKINYNSEVAEIKSQGNKVVSVRLKDNREVFGDVFISNVDYPYTQESLLNRREGKDFRYSFSGIQIFLGLKQKIRGLDHHNFFIQDDPQDFLRGLYYDGTIPAKPFFYVSLPTITESMLAPEGKDSLIIFIPVPNLSKMESIGEERIKAVRDWAVQTISQKVRIDLNQLIEIERFLKPDDYARIYNLKNGAVFGVVNSISQAALFKPINYDSKLDNLFYVGASTQPGNSLPLLIASGKIAYDLIREKSK